MPRPVPDISDPSETALLSEPAKEEMTPTLDLGPQAPVKQEAPQKAWISPTEEAAMAATSREEEEAPPDLNSLPTWDEIKGSPNYQKADSNTRLQVLNRYTDLVHKSVAADAAQNNTDPTQQHSNINNFNLETKKEIENDRPFAFFQNWITDPAKEFIGGAIGKGLDIVSGAVQAVKGQVKPEVDVSDIGKMTVDEARYEQEKLLKAQPELEKKKQEAQNFLGAQGDFLMGGDSPGSNAFNQADADILAKYKGGADEAHRAINEATFSNQRLSALSDYIKSGGKEAPQNTGSEQMALGLEKAPEVARDAFKPSDIWLNEHPKVAKVADTLGQIMTYSAGLLSGEGAPTVIAEAGMTISDVFHNGYESAKAKVDERRANGEYISPAREESLALDDATKQTTGVGSFQTLANLVVTSAFHHFGIPVPAGAKIFTLENIKRALLLGTGEMAAQGAIAGGAQIASNIADKESGVSPHQDMMANVPEAAEQGALLYGTIGAATRTATAIAHAKFGKVNIDQLAQYTRDRTSKIINSSDDPDINPNQTLQSVLQNEIAPKYRNQVRAKLGLEESAKDQQEVSKEAGDAKSPLTQQALEKTAADTAANPVIGIPTSETDKQAQAKQRLIDIANKRKADAEAKAKGKGEEDKGEEEKTIPEGVPGVDVPANWESMTTDQRVEWLAQKTKPLITVVKKTPETPEAETPVTEESQKGGVGTVSDTPQTTAQPEETKPETQADIDARRNAINIKLKQLMAADPNKANKTKALNPNRIGGQFLQSEVYHPTNGVDKSLYPVYQNMLHGVGTFSHPNAPFKSWEANTPPQIRAAEEHFSDYLDKRLEDQAASTAGKVQTPMVPPGVMEEAIRSGNPGVLLDHLKQGKQLEVNQDELEKLDPILSTNPDIIADYNKDTGNYFLRLPADKVELGGEPPTTDYNKGAAPERLFADLPATKPEFVEETDKMAPGEDEENKLKKAVAFFMGDRGSGFIRSRLSKYNQSYDNEIKANALELYRRDIRQGKDQPNPMVYLQRSLQDFGDVMKSTVTVKPTEIESLEKPEEESERTGHERIGGEEAGVYREQEAPELSVEKGKAGALEEATTGPAPGEEEEPAKGKQIIFKSGTEDVMRVAKEFMAKLNPNDVRALKLFLRRSGILPETEDVDASGINPKDATRVATAFFEWVRRTYPEEHWTGSAGDEIAQSRHSTVGGPGEHVPPGQPTTPAGAHAEPVSTKPGVPGTEAGGAAEEVSGHKPTVSGAGETAGGQPEQVLQPPPGGGGGTAGGGGGTAGGGAGAGAAGGAEVTGEGGAGTERTGGLERPGGPGTVTRERTHVISEKSKEGTGGPNPTGGGGTVRPGGGGRTGTEPGAGLAEFKQTLEVKKPGGLTLKTWQSGAYTIRQTEDGTFMLARGANDIDHFASFQEATDAAQKAKEEEAPPPENWQKLYDAWSTLSQERGRRSVSITDVAKRAGINLNQAKRSIQLMLPSRSINLDTGDWASATTQERAGAISHEGKPRLFVEFTTPPSEMTFGERPSEEDIAAGREIAKGMEEAWAKKAATEAPAEEPKVAAPTKLPSFHDIASEMMKEPDVAGDHDINLEDYRTPGELAAELESMAQDHDDPESWIREMSEDLGLIERPGKEPLPKDSLEPTPTGATKESVDSHTQASNESLANTLFSHLQHNQDLAESMGLDDLQSPDEVLQVFAASNPNPDIVQARLQQLCQKLGLLDPPHAPGDTTQSGTMHSLVPGIAGAHHFSGTVADLVGRFRASPDPEMQAFARSLNAHSDKIISMPVRQLNHPAPVVFYDGGQLWVSKAVLDHPQGEVAIAHEIQNAISQRILEFPQSEEDFSRVAHWQDLRDALRRSLPADLRDSIDGELGVHLDRFSATGEIDHRNMTPDEKNWFPVMAAAHSPEAMMHAAYSNAAFRDYLKGVKIDGGRTLLDAVEQWGRTVFGTQAFKYADAAHPFVHMRPGVLTKFNPKFFDIKKSYPLSHGERHMNGVLQKYRFRDGPEAMLQQVADVSANPRHRVLAKAILQALKDNPGIRVGLEDRIGSIAGGYDFHEDKVTVNPQIDDHSVEQSILHEITHALTLGKIRAYESGQLHLLSSDDIQAINRLEELRQEILSDRKTPEIIRRIANLDTYAQRERAMIALTQRNPRLANRYYGLTDLNEFAAETTSNGEFQDHLRSVKVKSEPGEGPRTGLQKAFDWVKRILGFKENTALSKAFDSVATLMGGRRVMESDFQAGRLDGTRGLLPEENLMVKRHLEDRAQAEGYPLGARSVPVEKLDSWVNEFRQGQGFATTEDKYKPQGIARPQRGAQIPVVGRYRTPGEVQARAEAAEERAIRAETPVKPFVSTETEWTKQLQDQYSKGLLTRDEYTRRLQDIASGRREEARAAASERELHELYSPDDPAALSMHLAKVTGTDHTDPDEVSRVADRALKDKAITLSQYLHLQAYANQMEHQKYNKILIPLGDKDDQESFRNRFFRGLRRFTTQGEFPKEMNEEILRHDKYAKQEAGNIMARNTEALDKALVRNYKTTNVSPTVMEQLNAILNGDPSMRRTMPDDVVAAVDAMGAHRDALTDTIVDEDMVPGKDPDEVHEKTMKLIGNRGKYVARQYRMFDEPRYLYSKESKAFRPAAEAEMEALMSARKKTGLARQIANDAKADAIRAHPPGSTAGLDAGNRAYEEALADAKANIGKYALSRKLAKYQQISRNKQTRNLQFGHAFAINDRLMTALSKLPPNIRAVMGEETDVRRRYVKTTYRQHAYINGIRLARGLYELGKKGGYISDRMTNTNTDQIPNQFAHLGELHGKYTTPQIAGALTNYAEQYNSIDRDPTVMRMLWALEGRARYISTIGSLKRSMANIQSGLYSHLNNGYFNVNGPAALKVIQANLLRMNTEELNAYDDKLTRLGLGDRESNLAQALDIIRRDPYAQMSASMDPLDFLGRLGDKMATNPHYKKASEILQQLHVVWNKASKASQFEQELVRQRDYNRDDVENGRAAKLDEDELERRAAQVVRETNVSYSMAVPWVKQQRKLPFMGPFLTYWEEAMRSFGMSIVHAVRDIRSPNKARNRVALQRFGGMITSLALPGALAAASRMIFGVNDKEDQHMRSLLPPWEQNNAIFYGPKDAAEKRRWYMNIGYSSPQSDIVRAIHALISPNPQGAMGNFQDTVYELLGPNASFGIIPGAFIDIARNQTPYGTQVYNPDDPNLMNQWGEIAQYGAQKGLGGTAGRMLSTIIPAATGHIVTSGGAVHTLPTAIINELGFDAKEISFPERFKSYLYSSKNSLENAQSIFTRPIQQSNNRLTDEQMTKLYQHSEDVRRNVFNQLNARVQAARFGGMKDSEIRSALHVRRYSSQMISDLMTGKYRPYKPGPGILKGAAAIGNHVPPHIFSHQIYKYDETEEEEPEE